MCWDIISIVSVVQESRQQVNKITPSTHTIKSFDNYDVSRPGHTARTLDVNTEKKELLGVDETDDGQGNDQPFRSM